MTAWTTISNALVAVGAKPFATTVQALRDNVIATTEGAAGAPVNQSAWHPYNMIAYGDGNYGKIYDFAVNGAVTTIVTPDFVDGYEYRLRFSEISLAAVATFPNAFQLQLYRETDGAYGTALSLGTMTANAVRLSGQIEINRPRVVSTTHIVSWNVSAAYSVDGGWSAPGGGGVCVRAAQKRLRARVLFSDPGSTDSGVIYMDKKLAV